MRLRTALFCLMAFSASFLAFAAARHPPPAPMLACYPPAHAGGPLFSLVELMRGDYAPNRAH